MVGYLRRYWVKTFKEYFGNVSDEMMADVIQVHTRSSCSVFSKYHVRPYSKALLWSMAITSLPKFQKVQSCSTAYLPRGAYRTDLGRYDFRTWTKPLVCHSCSAVVRS